MTNTLVIWDIDNTLYQDKTKWMGEMTQHLVNPFRELTGKTQQEVPDQEIRRLANISLKSTSFALKDLEEQYGISPEVLHKKMHAELNIEAIIPAKNITLAQSLNDTPSYIINTAYTHGSQEHARRVIDYVGVKNAFNQNLIFGAEDFNFTAKSRTTEPFTRMADEVKKETGETFEPSQTWLIEDSPRNIKHAQEMGIKTILIDWNDTVNNEKPENAQYADHVVRTPAEAYDLVKEYSPT